MARTSNALYLTGTVARIAQYDKYEKVTVRVTHSNRGSRDSISEYITVRFFYEDATGMDEILLGDRVRIKGHIGSSRREQEDGSMRIVIIPVGDAIEQVDASMQDENVVVIDGVVENILDGSRSKILHIVTWVDEKPYTLAVSFRPELVEEVENGNLVYARARLIPIEREYPNGKPRRHYAIRGFRIEKESADE